MTATSPVPVAVRLRRIALICAALVVLATIAFVAGWGDLLISDARLQSIAERELQRGNFASALSAAEHLLHRRPRSASALRLAASAAKSAGKFDVALQRLDRVEDDGSVEMADDWLNCGELCLQLGRLSTAEDFFRRAIPRDPSRTDALQKLLALLRIEARNCDARPLIERLLQLGDAPADSLYVLAMPDWVWLDPRESQFLMHCTRTVPDDPLPQFSFLRQAMLRGEFQRVVPGLMQAVRAYPEQAEFQAALGECLLQKGVPAEFLQWHQQLPKSVENHPQIWFVRAEWLSRHGHLAAAIRCGGEVICRDPNHRGACYRLSQWIRDRDHDAAAKFAERAAALGRVEMLTREVQSTPALLVELSTVLEQLGRLREAQAWAKLAVRQNANAPAAQQLIERLNPQLATGPPLALTVASPCALLQWLDYPLPGEDDFRDETKPTASPETVAQSSIAFSATEGGIAFRYDNGADSVSGRAWMFEFSGGGVAVLDYDGDGWPDLHLTQGGRWPPQTNSASTDRLYRNRGEGTFLDVTALAGAGETGFSQGVTVGDYDNDGFPDLYVANIGPNRFFHNNGDGTFRDVTAETATAGNEWSLSAALADLNADGLPDLYVTNYLAGDVLERACQYKGRAVQCFPTSFPAAQDRLYVNLGDGRFFDATSASGIELPDGKGMGLVVADFNGSRRPDLFIANDTTPNFLFRNQTLAPGEMPVFVDTGLLSGVALGEQGQAQSSMGIAVGDANGDGQLDLFVTNYIREPSNLFLQQPDHTFVDRAGWSGLVEPSFNLMKWGTQFLDADLDGDLDLVIANGHLDDYTSDGVPFRMPTQCFENLGGGRFREVPRRQLGPFFEGLALGRAVARGDWDRDGREDFCVTHVDAPFALLTNRTPSGHFLKLHLRGVRSSRDAITSTVRVTLGDTVLMRQLTAGDGFCASNERQLTFGLGPANRPALLTITWPTGEKQVLDGVAVDGEYVIIEGLPRLFALPK